MRYWYSNTKQHSPNTTPTGKIPLWECQKSTRKSVLVKAIRGMFESWTPGLRPFFFKYARMLRPAQKAIPGTRTPDLKSILRVLTENTGNWCSLPVEEIVRCNHVTCPTKNCISQPEKCTLDSRMCDNEARALMKSLSCSFISHWLWENGRAITHYVPQHG